VQAPLAVAVEVRALDVGARLVRAFRLSSSIGEDGIRLERDLPFEPGRPVAVELVLPDDAEPVRATGVVLAVAPSPADEEPEGDGEVARPRGVGFTHLPAEVRRRVLRYVEERMTPWPSP
jgi:hypothetical protein